MPGVQHLTVEPDETEQRLDRWFRRRFPHVPHGRVEKMLRKGEIRIDGARAKAADRVSTGQTVRVPPLPDPEEVSASRRMKSDAQVSEADREMLQACVLYKDAEVIVLNKPPGLPVQGGSGQARHLDGMLGALSFDRSDKPRLVHRLDKDTSGVLLLARTVPAAAALAKAFHGRDTDKIYWAAVSGVPKPRSGTIRTGLVKAPGHGPHGAGEKMLAIATEAVKTTEGAKRASTDFTVVEAMGDRAAWMALRPITGRTHQLRVHMAELGCPIVGDGKYGTNRIEKEDGRYGAQLGGEISRKLHLHARSIAIPHPAGKGMLRATAPLPDHMRRTWAAFGWDDGAAPSDPFEDIE